MVSNLMTIVDQRAGVVWKAFDRVAGRKECRADAFAAQKPADPIDTDQAELATGKGRRADGSFGDRQ